MRSQAVKKKAKVNVIAPKSTTLFLSLRLPYLAEHSIADSDSPLSTADPIIPIRTTHTHPSIIHDTCFASELRCRHKIDYFHFLSVSAPGPPPKSVSDSSLGAVSTHSTRCEAHSRWISRLKIYSTMLISKSGRPCERALQVVLFGFWSASSCGVRLIDTPRNLIILPTLSPCQ